MEIDLSGEHLQEIIPYLAFLSIICIIFIIRERILRKKLGAEAETVPLDMLSIKWMRYFVIILLILTSASILINIFFLEVIYLLNILMRLLVIVFLFYVMYRFSFLWFGRNGFIGPNMSFTSWSSVKSIEWDKDISQGLWGVSIYKKSGKIPVRLYVPRDKKKEVSRLVSKYFKEDESSRETG